MGKFFNWIGKLFSFVGKAIAIYETVKKAIEKLEPMIAELLKKDGAFESKAKLICKLFLALIKEILKIKDEVEIEVFETEEEEKMICAMVKKVTEEKKLT